MDNGHGAANHEAAPHVIRPQGAIHNSYRYLRPGISALAQVGYKVEVVETDAVPREPVLKCQVDRFYFNNYTWLAPIVPTWGSAALTTTLGSSDGRVLWSRSFKGRGVMLNFFNGYTSAANTSMQKILNKTVEAFASDEFRRALTSTG